MAGGHCRKHPSMDAYEISISEVCGAEKHCDEAHGEAPFIEGDCAADEDCFTGLTRKAAVAS